MSEFIHVPRNTNWLGFIQELFDNLLFQGSYNKTSPTDHLKISTVSLLRQYNLRSVFQFFTFHLSIQTS